MTELLAPAPTSPENLTESHLKYILCAHNPEFVDDVLQELGEAEIVAIETVGRTAEERKKYEDLLNAVARAPQGSAYSDASLLRLQEASNDVQKGFHAPIAEALAGSKKVFRLIDMGDDHPQAYKRKNFEKSNRVLDKALAGPDTSEALQAMESMIDAFTEWNISRDETMQAQVDEIELANPGKNIAVVAGFMHDETAEADVASGKATSVTLKPDQGEAAPNSPFNEALRAKRLSPSEKLDGTMLKRALLETASYEMDYDYYQAVELSQNTPDDELDMALNEMLELVRRKIQQDRAKKLAAAASH